MRAVVCQRGELTVEDVPTPEPGPGNLLLKVTRAGICGSDLHARMHCDQTADVVAEAGYDNFMRSAQPIVLGHEFVGELVSYGPSCRKRWKPGTAIVALPMLRHDGEVEMVGLSERAPGAYAEFVEVGEDVAMEVPARVDPDHAALTEPLAVAHHAVRRSDIGKGDVAVVVGCGPIGLAVILLLKAAGVRTVVASDLSPGRRALARDCGADVVVDPAVDSPFTATKKQNGHFTGAGDLYGLAFDAMHRLRAVPGVPWARIMGAARGAGLTPRGPVVFECVGVPGMFETLVTQVPFRSRIVVVGVCMEADTFRPVLANNKEIELRFVFAYDPDEFHETLQFLAKGKIDPSALITGTVGLDGVAAAFADLGDPEKHAKILIDPAAPADRV